MKILILSPFFHPEPISTGKYNSQLAKALVSAGHTVSAICSYPIYPQWQPIDVTEPEIPGTHVVRGGRKLKYPNKTLARRAILEGWYAWHVLKNIRAESKDCDAIVCVYPPSLFGLFAGLIANRKQKRVIGIIHDLQGVYAKKSSGIISKIIQKTIFHVERLSFNACDKLIFLSEEMRSWSISQYGLPKNKTLTNYPFTTISADTSTGDDYILSILPPKENFIVYSGALGEKQNPYALYNFFDRLTKENPSWKAAIFSQGPIFEQLKINNKNKSIIVNQLVDAEYLPSLLARSDIQVVPQAPGTSDGSLPSKLPNIIKSQTRLLCITDPKSELGNIVEKYSNGSVCYSWNEDEMLKAFNSLSKRKLPMNESDEQIIKMFQVETLVESITSN